MTDTALGRQIAEDMDYLAGAWPLLVLVGVPGQSTSRPLPPSSRITSEQARERAEREARQDRAAARESGYVPGSGPVPAPANVGLLDLLAAFVDAAFDVAEEVTQCAGVERPPHPSSCWVDPRPYLAAARTWLSVACDASAGLEVWVGERAHQIADRVSAYLGELHDGQRLLALCPWCGGRTEQHPMGGELTLVVYAKLSRDEQTARPADAKRPKVGDRVRDERPLIVCRGSNCTPPESAVGVYVGAAPAWPMREWDWLAKQLQPVTLRALVDA